MAEINDAYAALTARPTRPRGTARRRRGGRPFEPSVGAATRRPAATEADPAGDRPGRHERHVPAAQPGDGRHTARDGHPPPASRRSAPIGRPRTTARLDADRARCVRDRMRHFRRPSRRRSSDGRGARSSSSASSTATRSARSRRSSRRTSTGSPGTVTRDPDLVAAARVDPGRPGPARRPRRARPTVRSDGGRTA